MKVELHVHTKYSYDTNTSLEDIVRECLKKQISAIAITDHNEIQGARYLAKMAPFKVIVGEEILTSDGEIIGLFLREFVPPGLTIEETIKKIKRQGGVTYLPHPFDTLTRKTSIKYGLIKNIAPKVDIIEVFNGRTINQLDNNKALKLAKELRKPSVVGSDAHSRFELGRNTLDIPEFGNAREFIKALSKAKKQTARPEWYPFLVTKWVRYWKRRRGAPVKQVVSSSEECQICGSNTFELVYHKKKDIPNRKYLITDKSYGAHGQIVKCKNCSLKFVYPRENPKTITKRYKTFEDPEYEKERATRVKGQSGILKNLSHYFPKRGKMLEIGCATGLFLEKARSDGWETYGVEPSIWASKIARETYGLNVKQGTLGDIKFKSRTFDVCILIDVIEHVTNPRKIIEEIHKILKSDGMVCIVTPNSSSLITKVLSEKWWHIRPDHIYYFSKKSLGSLLLATGYRVQVWKSYGWTFTVDYWLSRLGGYSPSLYKLISKLLNNGVGSAFLKKDITIDFRDLVEVYAFKS